jgi:predicted dehydrogenase
MAIDYAKVLTAIEIDFSVFGRGARSAKTFRDATGCAVKEGGIAYHLTVEEVVPRYAIVAVSVEDLATVTLQLLEYGIANILVEKPAGLTKADLTDISSKAEEKKANVYVAYNRRFYASTQRARNILLQEGGVLSFNFEFTEWSHKIENLDQSFAVKRRWFLANSTHVVDLAFYLGGQVQELSAYVSRGLNWHPTGAIFSGAGVAQSGALFSYLANWESAGRWGLELLTSSSRLILRPLEELYRQKRGELEVTHVKCDDQLDRDFKPGLYAQTRSFLSEESQDLCSISEQEMAMDNYMKIANYSDKFLPNSMCV